MSDRSRSFIEVLLNCGPQELGLISLDFGSRLNESEHLLIHREPNKLALWSSCLRWHTQMIALFYYCTTLFFNIVSHLLNK